MRQIMKEVALFASTLRRVIVLNWRVSPDLYISQFVIAVVQGVLPLLSALFAGVLLGTLANQIARHSTEAWPLLWPLGGLAISQFATVQLAYLRTYLDDLFGLSFDRYIQQRLYDRVHQLDQSYYEDQDFNNRLNKITQNSYALRGLNQNFFYALNSLVELLTTAAALLVMNPWVAVIISGALIPTLIVEVKTSLRQWRSWDEKGNDRRLQWYFRGLLLDVVNLREIKLYALKDFLVSRWRHHFEANRRVQLGIEQRAQTLRALTGALTTAVELGVQAWLVMRTLAGRLDLGGFVFYRQIIMNYANAGAGLVRNIHSMQEQSLYVNDYFELMALEPRLTSPADSYVLPSGTVPRIEFEQVTFRYPGSKEPVLQDLSLVIEPGQDMAIVGANGAGKTTLIKLLMRLYDPTEGRILVDGHDLRELDLASWYRCVGTLFQDFNRYSSLTVKDNIAAGRSDAAATSTAIEAAAQDAGAEAFVRDYPLGFDQRLNRSFQDGVEPSGGQWQRIALARAFFRNAGVLILDEPTSAIDAKGEFEIFEQIAKTQRDKTTIIISHRFSTVRNAGKIVVLENGSIIEQGSHEELVARAGRYHELFELQAVGYR